jgi:GNAT superfamily N-acetyltransferase
MKTLEPKTEILIAQTAEDIDSCFLVFQELRDEIKDRQIYIEQVIRQTQEGYTLTFIREHNEVASCMGYRIFETLGWGKILYIDDLITRAKSRKKGFGKILLEYAIEQGRFKKCDQIHLDSGFHRLDAHRLYLNKGFNLACHHLALLLN